MEKAGWGKEGVVGEIHSSGNGIDEVLVLLEKEESGVPLIASETRFPVHVILSISAPTACMVWKGLATFEKDSHCRLVRSDVLEHRVRSS